MIYIYICDYLGQFTISSRKLDDMWFECEEVLESELDKRFRELVLMGYELVE